MQSTEEQRPTSSRAKTPGPSRKRARPSRGWKVLIGGICGLLCLLLLLAPTLVAWSPLRHDVPRVRLKGYPGKIRVGSASLAWWSPIELRDVELFDLQGNSFITVERYNEERTVWTLLFDRDDPPRLTVSRPVVNVVLRDDGSNAEDLLRPVLEQRRSRPRERQAEVVEGQVKVSEPHSGKSWEWRDVALGLKSTLDPKKTGSAHLEMRLTGAPEAGPLTVDISFPAGDGIFMFGRTLATVNTQRLPLSVLNPLVHRALSPDLELQGELTSNLRTEFAVTAPMPSIVFDLDVDVTAGNLEVSWPSRLGDDRPALPELMCRVQAAADGRACRVSRFLLRSELGHFEAGGRIPMPRFDEPSPDPTNKGNNAEFKIEGNLDLARLASLVPQTLRLRDDVRLTEGKALVLLATTTSDVGPVWSGRLATSKLAAAVGGEPMVWDQPIQLAFDVRQGREGLALDSLTCESDVIHLTGRGEEHKGHIAGTADLSQITARLGQFFDLSDWQIAGQVDLDLDLERTPQRQYIVAGRTQIDRLLVRRQIETLVERRRGDIEAIEAPAVAAPQPLPGERLQGRARREMRKTQREAEREQKRRDKEARKLADQTVLVPQLGWQTLWEDERLVVSAETRIDRDGQRLELPRLAVESGGLRLNAAGNVFDLSRQADIELAGEVDYDLSRLVARLPGAIARYIQLEGQERRKFSVSGPLRFAAEKRPPSAQPEGAVGHALAVEDSRIAGSGAGGPAQVVAQAAARPLVPAELTAQAGLGWRQGNLFGLAAGPADIEWRLADQVLAMRPLEMTLSGGKLHLAPRVELSDQPATIVIPAGRLVENVQLSQELCDAWLKFVAPVFADATRVEGTFSVDLKQSRLPVGEPETGDLGGRLSIHAAQALPGALFGRIAEIIAQVQSSVGLNPHDLIGLERPLVRIDDQQIDFALRGGRIHNSPLAFQMRNIPVRTRGSVGLDQTLDLVAEIEFPAEWAQRAPLLARLTGRPLEIAIGGTLRDPDVDASGIGRLAEDIGGSLLDGLLNGGLRGLFRRQ
ncbi:MAG: hypothetical protein ACT4QC_08850 [Planctomycetaceae bacterium]